MRVYENKVLKKIFGPTRDVGRMEERRGVY
jgi:hypothetical protein